MHCVADTESHKLFSKTKQEHKAPGFKGAVVVLKWKGDLLTFEGLKTIILGSQCKKKCKKASTKIVSGKAMPKGSQKVTTALSWEW